MTLTCMEMAERMGRREIALSPSGLWALADRETEGDPEKRKELYLHAAWHAGMFERVNGESTCPKCGKELPDDRD